MNFRPFGKGFLNGPLQWILWRTAPTRDVTTTLRRHSNASNRPELRANNCCTCSAGVPKMFGYIILNISSYDNKQINQYVVHTEASSVKYSIWLTVKQTVVRCYGANTATHLKTAKCPYRPYWLERHVTCFQQNKTKWMQHGKGTNFGEVTH